jgi:hypothetical protein
MKFKDRVLPWQWERAGNVSDKRSFGIAGIWPRLRAILFTGG